MALYGPALVDIVGLNNIEVTSGILMVSKGLANLSLHSLAGLLMDATGSTNTPFYVFGSTQTLGGIIVMTVPYIQRFLHRYDDLSDESSDLTIEVFPSDTSSDSDKVPPNDTVMSSSVASFNKEHLLTKSGSVTSLKKDQLLTGSVPSFKKDQLLTGSVASLKKDHLATSRSMASLRKEHLSKGGSVASLKREHRSMSRSSMLMASNGSMIHQMGL